MANITWTPTTGATTSITTTSPWINTSGGTATYFTYLNDQVMQYSEHECGIHDIVYKAIRPGCPLCSANQENATLRDSVKKLSGQLELTSDKLRQMETAWDWTLAMKEAAPLLNDEDLEFFKKVLYMWRDEKSTALKITHGYADKKKKKSASANGFIVMTRGEEPWGYACTSIGGLAICSYFEEACGARGHMQAMVILTRALSDHLPGSLDEPGYTAS